jgi:hypothetical protein
VHERGDVESEGETSAAGRNEPTAEQSEPISAAIAARSGGGFYGYRGAPPATLDGEAAVRITEDTYAGGAVSSLCNQEDVMTDCCGVVRSILSTWRTRQTCSCTRGGRTLGEKSGSLPANSRKLYRERK